MSSVLEKSAHFPRIIYRNVRGCTRAFLRRYTATVIPLQQSKAKEKYKGGKGGKIRYDRTSPMLSRGFSRTTLTLDRRFRYRCCLRVISREKTWKVEHKDVRNRLDATFAGLTKQIEERNFKKFREGFLFFNWKSIDSRYFFPVIKFTTKYASWQI